MRLNLGCGAVLLPPPWLNVDHARPVVPQNYTFAERDLREGLPWLMDNAVELVYIAHMLDHLDLPDAVRLLQECHRVMQPGALARLTVMDLAKILAVYEEGNIDRFARWQPKLWKKFRTPSIKLALFLFGSMSGEERYTGHWWVVDFAGMEEICRLAGFRDVRRLEFGKSQSRVFEVEVADCYPDHSQYVEVRK